MKQTYTWYSNETSIDSPDTIHQILEYGTLQDITELKKKVGLQKLKNIFLAHPKKVYTPASFNFISKFILTVTTPIHKDAYLKSTSRNIR